MEDHDGAEDYDPDWNVSMDIRNEQSPKRHIDQNNEFSSEEEDKDLDEGISYLDTYTFCYFYLGIFLKNSIVFLI